jgi:hypothetical protein
MEDKVLEFHNKGWRADRIAALFTLHTHVVEEIIANAPETSKKKDVEVVIEGKLPKIKKISKK